MRLIDADRLRKKLLMMECMDDVVEIIDNEPTAYNIDKVVKELNNQSFIDNQVVDLYEAIKIVKAGGKNE